MARTMDVRQPEQVGAMSSTALLDVFLLLNRVTLGWYILSAGSDKVSEEISKGFGTFLASGGFQNRGAILPAALAAPFGYVWPWAEVITGALLILGLFGRINAAVTAIMLGLISFTLVFTGELFPRHHSIVFCTMALTLYLLGPGRYSVDAMFRGKR
jgi:putative oxidoreductase